LLLLGECSGADDLARMPVAELVVEKVEQHRSVAALMQHLLVERTEPRRLLPVSIGDLADRKAARMRTSGDNPLVIARHHDVQTVRLFSRRAPLLLDRQRVFRDHALEPPFGGLVAGRIGFIRKQETTLPDVAGETPGEMIGRTYVERMLSEH